MIFCKPRPVGGVQRGMRVAPLLVLPLLVVVAGTREAPAVCAAPGAAVFPLGDQLPPDPILYRFEPSWLQPATLRIEGPDGPVGFSTRVVPSGDELRITEIRVAARRGSITLHAGDGEAPRQYEVGAETVVVHDSITAEDPGDASIEHF